MYIKYNLFALFLFLLDTFAHVRLLCMLYGRRGIVPLHLYCRGNKALEEKTLHKYTINFQKLDCVASAILHVHEMRCIHKMGIYIVC